jgi:sulfur transfer protein SufE
MLNCKARQEEIVEEFSFYEDWMEKYEQLIEMGKGTRCLAR